MTRSSTFAAASAIALMVFGAATARAQGYHIQTLNYPGSEETQLYGINNVGQIVGNAISGGFVADGGIGGAYTASAFVDTRGSFNAFESPTLDPRFYGTTARAINDSGQIVGAITRYSDGTSQAYLDTAGAFTNVDLPVVQPPVGELRTIANGIADTGQIVGSIDLSVYLFGTNAYLDYRNGSYTSFPFTDPTNVNNFYDAEAQGINNYGAIVGDYYVPYQSDGFVGGGGSNASGFVWDANGMRSIDVPGAAETYAHAINAGGEVVGSYLQAGPTDPAHPGNVTLTQHGFVDVGGVFTALDVPGALMTDVWGVNDSGSIVGWYQDPTDLLDHGFIATPDIPNAPIEAESIVRGPFVGFPPDPVPEPATWALMILGVGGVGGAMRRRGRQPRAA